MAGSYFLGSLSAQIFTGGIEHDTVDYSSSTAIRIDLLNNTALGGFAEGDLFISIEKIIGSNSSLSTDRDWLWGDNNANQFWGMAGNDILEGGGGADILDGGAGWDYARYTRSNEAVHINLKTGVNTGGDAQGDVLIDIEAIVGSKYNDIIRGGHDGNYIRDENGDDVLSGGAGSDKLFGGNGYDVALFDRNFEDYTITDSGNTRTINSTEGVDTLTDMSNSFLPMAPMKMGSLHHMPISLGKLM